MQATRLVRSRLEDRVRVSRAWAALLHRAPRFGLAVVLSVAPAAALVLAAWLGPEELGKAVTDTRNVHDAFARFVSAVATASAIAVSVAALTLRRELKGVGRQEERGRTNEEYRERVRKAAGLAHAPLGLGPFLAAGLQAARDAARRARDAATDQLDATVGDVALGEYLDAVEAATERAAARLARAGPRPHAIAVAALDVEEEMTMHLARGFQRMLAGDAARRLAELEDALRDVVHGANYAKTLDVQWGFSRMAQAIAISSFPAIVVAAGMVLAYGDGAVDALGRVGAAGLVAGALAVTLLPLACFVSYVLRFVFLNEHTLPTDAFILGPEEPDVVRAEGRRARGTGRPG